MHARRRHVAPSIRAVRLAQAIAVTLNARIDCRRNHTARSAVAKHATVPPSRQKTATLHGTNVTSERVMFYAADACKVKTHAPRRDMRGKPSDDDVPRESFS